MQHCVLPQVRPQSSQTDLTEYAALWTTPQAPVRTVQQLLRTPSCVDAPQRRMHPAAAAGAGDGGGGGSGGRHLQGRLQGGGVKRRRRREGRLQRGPETGDEAESGDDISDDAAATAAGAYTGGAGMGAWAMMHMQRYNFMSSASAVLGGTSVPGSAAHGGVGGDDSVGVPSEAHLWQVRAATWMTASLPCCRWCEHPF